MMGTALLHNRVLQSKIRAEAVLNDNSWDTISKVSAAGKAANFWAVGDTKQITINGTVANTAFSKVNIWVFIAGFDHNSAIEGSNTIHFQIGKSAQTGGKNLCLLPADYDSMTEGAGNFVINDTNTDTGGWQSCKMRNTILGNSNNPSSPLSGSLMAALPADLRTVMKGVTKYTDNVGGSNVARSVTATTDYLWLLAEYELRGANDGSGYGFAANKTERSYQQQYDYYAAGNSKKFYGHRKQSTACEHWTRSPRVTTSGNSWLYVDYGGFVPSIDASSSMGIAPMFCV